jgi:two-component system chemotaxis response regulator CheY
MSPPRKVLFVGHCGPDSTYLRRAVKSVAPDAVIALAEDDQSLLAAVSDGVDLVLLNRELYGHEPETGVEMIAALRQKFPSLRMMLISNYPDAQAAAVAAGAVPGFGKREISSPQAMQRLRDALSEPLPQTRVPGQ